MHPNGCSGRVVDSKFATTAMHPWTEGNAHRPRLKPNRRSIRRPAKRVVDQSNEEAFGWVVEQHRRRSPAAARSLWNKAKLRASHNQGLSGSGNVQTEQE